MIPSIRAERGRSDNSATVDGEHDPGLVPVSDEPDFEVSQLCDSETGIATPKRTGLFGLNQRMVKSKPDKIKSIELGTPH